MSMLYISNTRNITIRISMMMNLYMFQTVTMKYLSAVFVFLIEEVGVYIIHCRIYMMTLIRLLMTMTLLGMNSLSLER